MLGHPVLPAKYFVYTAFPHGLKEVTWAYKVWQTYKGLQGIVWLQWVTKGYRGLQWVTREYKGLQGVTKGFESLQGVKRGYKGLQGVTSGNRSFRKKKWTLIVRRKSDTHPNLQADSKSFLGDTVLFLQSFCCALKWWACRTICLLSYLSYNLLVIYS